jgi:hypothetical protein
MMKTAKELGKKNEGKKNKYQKIKQQILLLKKRYF